MIVICTKCQAKFRVADEKIGARGAKVRCSKCQTVFLVRPEPAASAEASPSAGIPGSGLDLEPARGPGAAPVENPFAASPAGWDPTQPDVSSPAPARAGPPPLPPPLPQARPDDPFAAVASIPPSDAPSQDPFAPAASPDPFARAGPPDPFAPSSDPDPFAPPRPDPFGVAAPAEPFAPGASSANATDLGDLLDAAASAAREPFAAGASSDAPGAPAAEVSEDGLALEERAPAPPKPASSAPFDLGAEAGYDAFAGAGDAQAFDPGSLELGGPTADVPPLAGGPVGALELSGPALDAAPRPPAAPRAGGAVAAPAGAAPEAHAHERIPGRPSGLRSLALNAVALAALLVAAVAILALWRREGPLDAGALRPSAIVAALRGGGGDAPFATREVRSGLYERERAPPVLFVRGSVVSRSAAPVARVRVRVEIVHAGAVVASGEAIAGAVPTPEEIWGARDAAALAAVASAAGGRAPAEVRPGDSVPFLVAIADPPADLAGASLRVEAAPAGSSAP